MKIVINFLLSAIVSFIAVLFLPGLDVNGYLPAIYIAVVLGIFNVCIKPLLEVLSIVPTFITIILALFFFNGAVLVLADWILEDFAAEGTGYVILFSAVVAIVNWGIHRVLYQDRL